MKNLVLDFSAVSDGQAGIPFKASSPDAGDVEGRLEWDWEQVGHALSLPFAALPEIALEAAIYERTSQEGRDDTAHTERPDPQSLARIGAALFNAVFQGDVRTMLERARARSEGRVHLVIKASPHRAATARALALPWELLCEAGLALGLSPATPITRYVELGQPCGPLASRRGGLLIVLGRTDLADHRLRLVQEVDAIRAALGGTSGLPVEVLEAPSADQLGNALVRGDFRILHYAGHARFDLSSGSGALLLDDAVPVPFDVFAQLVGGQDRVPHLVVLNACSTARLSLRPGHPPQAAAITLLARVPTTVAMRSVIPDHSAMVFAQALYRDLASGRSLSVSVAAGRQATFASRWRGGAFCLPVLFTRSMTPWSLADSGGFEQDSADSVQALIRTLNVGRWRTKHLLAVRTCLVAHTAGLDQVAEIATRAGLALALDGASGVGAAWLQLIRAAQARGQSAMEQLLAESLVLLPGLASTLSDPQGGPLAGRFGPMYLDDGVR